MSAPEVVHTYSMSVDVLVIECSKSSQRTIFIKKIEHLDFGELLPLSN